MYSNCYKQYSTYFLMQDIINHIIELYHMEHSNLNMQQPLLGLSPNMEVEELILSIIEQTNHNLNYLSQIYFGFTGKTIDKLAMPKIQNPTCTFLELLKTGLFSKIDTLAQYENLYRSIPIQPYKDVLFQVIIGQIRDATTYNYLISCQN